MPHNTLRLSGGTIQNETPVLNQAGITSSNLIRFKYDPQGLTLVEKIGGWAKFFASTLTTGVIRMLWGWQDTNNNQWIAFAEESTTASELAVIQCTVNNSTGLTSATGSLQNITPFVRGSNQPISVNYTSGSNIFNITDLNVGPSTLPTIATVYITTPITAGGVILSGLYEVVPGSDASSAYNITALDILGNPANAQFSNSPAGGLTISGITYTSGPPSTLTITFTGGPYTFPVGSNVNVAVADGSVYGSFPVLSSATTTVTIPTSLGSYTFTSSGLVDNWGAAPVFTTTSSSQIVTVQLPNHTFQVGDLYAVLNPTLVGGITLQGTYVVQTVPNSYSFTINASSAATASSLQYQGARTVTGGSRVSTSVTLTNANLGVSAPLSVGGDVLVQGVNPSTWDGWFPITAISPTSITYTDASAAGSYVSGGSYSLYRGWNVYIYAQTNPSSLGSASSYPGTFWSLDNWGNDLLASPQGDAFVKYPNGFAIPYSPIYYWDPTDAYIYAQVIPNCPPANNGFFVAMPQRQIIAWGSTFTGVIDPLLVRWCDVNNFTTWVAQVINQAGSFRLPSGSAIIGGRQTPQQGLLWTDIELWSMTYINQPLIYSFNKIGQGCGLIGKYAHGILNGVVYWMGKTQIFMVSGDGVVAIPCPIWDVVFQDLDLVNADKVTCATNAMFQEITWYAPVKGGTGENGVYIKLYVGGMVAGQPPLWDYGTLDRSAWLDVSVLQQPIGFSPVNHYLYQHEIAPDADGSAMGETFTTGWFALAESDVMPFVDQVYPDFKWGYYGQSQGANVNLTINGADFPQTTAQTVGPYTVTDTSTLISPRMRHRLLSFTVAGTGTGTWWRLGGIRYRYQPDGKF